MGWRPQSSLGAFPPWSSSACRLSVNQLSGICGLTHQDSSIWRQDVISWVPFPCSNTGSERLAFLNLPSLGWIQFRQIHDAPFPATMKFQHPVMRISEECMGADGGWGGNLFNCHIRLANTFASPCYFVLRYDFSNRTDNGRLKL